MHPISKLIIIILFSALNPTPDTALNPASNTALNPVPERYNECIMLG
jgi:hypothetical protein